MRKFPLFIIIFAVLCVVLFFSCQIFEKRFFNEEYIITPDFVTMSVTDAAILAKSKGLSVKQVGEAFSEYDMGKIYQQGTIPGKKVKKGRIIQIYVSKGKSQVRVPALAGLDLTAGRIFAEKAGINIGNVIMVSSSIEGNKIIASDPAEGEYLSKNGAVVLLVSSGNSVEQIFMPDIIGIDVSKAKEILRKHNLLLGNIEYITDDYLDSDIILDSTPKAGDKLNAGSVVNIVVNKK